MVASSSWAALRMSVSPPRWTNVEMVSTSEVTRETSDPRRSADWVSAERSWTWRKVRTRSWASPRSLVRYSRTLTRALTWPVTISTARPTAHTASTRPTSGPPGARMPWSVACWMTTGTTMRPAVATRASSNVVTRPSVRAGESRTP